MGCVGGGEYIRCVVGCLVMRWYVGGGWYAYDRWISCVFFLSAFLSGRTCCRAIL